MRWEAVLLDSDICGRKSLSGSLGSGGVEGVRHIGKRILRKIKSWEIPSEDKKLAFWVACHYCGPAQVMFFERRKSRLDLLLLLLVFLLRAAFLLLWHCDTCRPHRALDSMWVTQSHIWMCSECLLDFRKDTDEAFEAIPGKLIAQILIPAGYLTLVAVWRSDILWLSEHFLTQTFPPSIHGH